MYLARALVVPAAIIFGLLIAVSSCQVQRDERMPADLPRPVDLNAEGSDELRGIREVLVETLPERQMPDLAEQELPTYRQLAYRPDKAVSLLDLPSTFFTVQVIAVSSKDALEAFVRTRQLRSMSAARIERSGALYYVLLLGVYANAELAKRAAQHLPAGLEDATPWVRSLASIQQAMLRADQLSGSADF